MNLFKYTKCSVENGGIDVLWVDADRNDISISEEWKQSHLKPNPIHVNRIPEPSERKEQIRQGVLVNGSYQYTWFPKRYEKKSVGQNND